MNTEWKKRLIPLISFFSDDLSTLYLGVAGIPYAVRFPHQRLGSITRNFLQSGDRSKERRIERLLFGEIVTDVLVNNKGEKN